MLNTTTLPFLPVRNIMLGFDFPFEMVYLEAGTDILVITSNAKRLITAIQVTDGNPIWSLGPVAAGREIHPHAVCSSPKGDFENVISSKNPKQSISLVNGIDIYLCFLMEYLHQ